MTHVSSQNEVSDVSCNACKADGRLPQAELKPSKAVRNGRHAPLRQASSDDESEMDEAVERATTAQDARSVRHSHKRTPHAIGTTFGAQRMVQQKMVRHTLAAAGAILVGALLGVLWAAYQQAMEHQGHDWPSTHNLPSVPSSSSLHQLASAVRSKMSAPPHMPLLDTPPPPPNLPPPAPPSPLPPLPPPPTVPPSRPPPAQPVASFLAIGDWGYLDEWRPLHQRTSSDHGWYHNWQRERVICTAECQGKLATRMAYVAAELAGTTKPVKFVVNAGDNFYPAGVISVDDPVWDVEWGQVYKDLPSNIPWYSVYGNHDYGSQFNRECACDLDDAGDGAGSSDGGRACFQVRKHGSIHGGQVWHMPAMSYHAVPIPGVNLEILALDLNLVDSAQTCPWIACGKVTCAWDAPPIRQGCTLSHCTEVMRRRADAAVRLVKRRVEAAERADTQLIIVSHYPTTWVNHVRTPDGVMLVELLNNPRVHILYFGAHVHSTDNTTNVHSELRRTGWRDFCIGGGGGWACDGQQGFVVGEVLDNGRVTNLRIEWLPNSVCCLANPNPRAG